MPLIKHHIQVEHVRISRKSKLRNKSRGTLIILPRVNVQQQMSFETGFETVITSCIPFVHNFTGNTLYFREPFIIIHCRQHSKDVKGGEGVR